ncbi:MAG: hypothetical protein ACRDXB_08065, partial [Actinomycetes bacterium]
ILASWLKDREEFIDTVKDTSYRASYEVIFHTVRSWLYALRLVCYAPRGIWRFTKLITAAIAHVETRQLRTHAAWHTDTKEGARVYLALKKDRDATVSRRLVALGILSVLTTVGLLGLWHLAPRWEITTWWVLTRGWLFGILGGVTVGVFGYVGRPLGQPLVAQATLPNGDPKLTNDIVLEALCSLGIPKMTDPAQIQLLYGVKPSRAGYHIDLTLPRGVAATEVMAKRPKLSSDAARYRAGQERERGREC